MPSEKWSSPVPVGAMTYDRHPKPNPVPLFAGNFSSEEKGLTRTENELPSCSKKWSARRGAHYLCCAAAGAFIWRGDERET